MGLFILDEKINGCDWLIKSMANIGFILNFWQLHACLLFTFFFLGVQDREVGTVWVKHQFHAS